MVIKYQRIAREYIPPFIFFIKSVPAVICCINNGDLGTFYKVRIGRTNIYINKQDMNSGT